MGGYAAVLAAALLSPAAASARTAYVSNSFDGNVTPINTATNAPGATITVGTAPTGVAITPGGKTAYVDNAGDNTVTPIDTADNAAGTLITGVNNPTLNAITPNGKTLYVVDSSSGHVIPIDTATNTAGTPIAVGPSPAQIAITPDGKTAYVANQGSNNVTPIDTATNAAGATITVGNGPFGISLTPNGKTAYVTNGADGTVTPIDTATNTAGTPIPVGTGPGGVAITPDGKTAYVSNFSDNTVTPIDVATNTAAAPIAVGPSPIWIAIAPDGKTAYVNDFDQGVFTPSTVTPINIPANTAGTQIPVGANPYGIAIVPNQGPTAAFTATQAVQGNPTNFDASGSNDPDGTVASYQWDFGDGSTQTTSSPTTTHTYASGGNFTATLTVTDNEGCSTAFIYTGQTASCNGSSAAQASHQVAVTPLHTLTITTRGSGQGSVTSSPAGIDCGAGGSAGSSCSHDYAEGTQVTLTAAANTAATFRGFKGAGCSGTATSCTVMMSQAQTVYARFEPAVKNLKLDPKSFVPDTTNTPLGPPPPKAKKGTTITFDLGGDALVRFQVRRSPRHASGSGPRVPHAFDRRLKAGKGLVAFTGTLGKHTLKPGKYQLLARAIDESNGYRSKRVSAKFSVLGVAGTP